MHEPFLSSRNHFDFFEQSCLEILNKARYRRYPIDFSILSDFDDEDLKGLMEIGTKYSGLGSDTDAVTVKNETFSATISTRDLCEGFEDYSKSNATATSWATAVITAAESAYLKKEGSSIKFSLKHLLTCLPLSSGLEPNKLTNSDIYRFITDTGLMTEDDANLLDSDNLCTDDVFPKYHFQVAQIDAPNKGGLMNLVAEGNPVVTLLALDLLRLRVTNDVTGDYIYTGAAYEPTLYGVIQGYDADKWIVTFNVVPCENIVLQLPVTESDTNANYAGIAGYAFSIAYKETSTPEPPSDPNKVRIVLSASYSTTPTTSGTVKLIDVIDNSIEYFTMELTGEDGESSQAEVPLQLMKIVVEGGPWSEGSILTITNGTSSDSIDLSKVSSSKEYYYHPKTGLVPDEEIAEANDCDSFKEALTNSMIVHLAAGKCNDSTASFSIKDNDKVVMLIIEKDNFPSMNALMIDGAENLEYLIFGDTTISYIPGGSGRRLPDTTKTFQITNSPKLAYIQIGDRMFTDFTEFTMSNLPSLRLLQIGSENFESVSKFSITSKNMNE